jgi:phage terminase small subunit
MTKEKYELAEEDYITGMKYKDIAEKYNVTLNTVKSWKTRYRWSKDGAPKTKKSVHTKREKVCTQNKKGAYEKDMISNEVIGVIDNTELPEKQRIFVAEYLKDFNATRAALAAGYSKNTAREQGCRLLTNVNVQAEVKRQTEVLFDSIGLTAQRILMEYMRIAHADINDYLAFGQREVPVLKDGEPVLDSSGKLITKTVNYVDFKESSEVDTSLISEVKQGKDGVSIKLHDKMKALDMLAKYMNLIVDNINVQQNNIIIKLEDD